MRRDPHIYIFGILIVIAVIAFAVGIGTSKPGVLGSTTTHADVLPCSFKFSAYPEKRIPATGNWSELLDIQIYDPDTLSIIFDEQVMTNNLGEAIFPDCPGDLFTEGDQYDVIVKGESHLRHRYEAFTFTNIPVLYINLIGEPRLLAGDTDIPTGDNDVDSNDVDENILHLYSVTNQRNDLNRDGEVNSLDLGNTLTNRGLTGD